MYVGQFCAPNSNFQRRQKETGIQW